MLRYLPRQVQHQESSYAEGQNQTASHEASSTAYRRSSVVGSSKSYHVNALLRALLELDSFLSAKNIS
jgi:hypothetical protein